MAGLQRLQRRGHALAGHGFAGIGEVRVGKLIELELAETDPARAKAAAEEMARKLLANMVIESFKVEDWDRALAVNLSAAFHVTRLALPGMRRRDFGRIVNITSRSVKAPLPHLGLSNGARAGLTGFVAGVARQVTSPSKPRMRASAKLVVKVWFEMFWSNTVIWMLDQSIW